MSIPYNPRQLTGEGSPKGRRLSVGILIGIVVLACLAGGVIVANTGRGSQETMKLFAQALADGDAERARSYTNLNNGDAPEFNKEVLESAKSIGGLISNVHADGCSDCVKANFDGSEITLKWDTVKKGRDYIITNPVRKLEFISVFDDKNFYGFTIAGLKDTYNLRLPVGIYPLKNDNPYIALPDNRVKIEIGADTIEKKLEFKLTESGDKLVRDAVKASFDACLARHELAPEGCPFSVKTEKYAFKNETIQWSLVGENPIDSMKFDLDFTGVGGQGNCKLHIEGEATEISSGNAGVYTGDRGSQILLPKVDISKNPPVVKWYK